MSVWSRIPECVPGLAGDEPCNKCQGRPQGSQYPGLWQAASGLSAFYFWIQEAQKKVWQETVTWKFKGKDLPPTGKTVIEGDPHYLEVFAYQEEIKMSGRDTNQADGLLALPGLDGGWL